MEPAHTVFFGDVPAPRTHGTRTSAGRGDGTKKLAGSHQALENKDVSEASADGFYTHPDRDARCYDSRRMPILGQTQPRLEAGAAMCVRNVNVLLPAIHINSRSWLRSSSIHEPSDPPLGVFFCFFFF